MNDTSEVRREANCFLKGLKVGMHPALSMRKAERPGMLMGCI